MAAWPTNEDWQHVQDVVVRGVNVTIEKYRRTDLHLATSDDMPGLMIHGRSLDEIVQRLPERIEALALAIRIEDQLE